MLVCDPNPSPSPFPSHYALLLASSFTNVDNTMKMCKVASVSVVGVGKINYTSIILRIIGIYKHLRIMLAL